jgi:hypothetical protein
LSERYQRELLELVEQGEISASFAKRVMEDLFIPEEAGGTRRLRPSVWRAYIAELTGDFS